MNRRSLVLHASWTTSAAKSTDAANSTGHEDTDPSVERTTPDEDVEEWIAQLRAVMWLDAGLLRDAAGLQRAQTELTNLGITMPQGLSRRAVEARNMHLVAAAMVQAALGREESRGAHFRKDFPHRAAVAQHSVLRRGKLRFVD